MECNEIENWPDATDNEENSPKYSPCLNTWVFLYSLNFHLLHLISKCCFFYFKGDNAKFDFGDLHQFPFRSDTFYFEIVDWHICCWFLFMDYI